jgi:hypothetical protein
MIPGYGNTKKIQVVNSNELQRKNKKPLFTDLQQVINNFDLKNSQAFIHENKVFSKHPGIEYIEFNKPELSLNYRSIQRVIKYHINKKYKIPDYYDLSDMWFNKRPEHFENINFMYDNSDIEISEEEITFYENDLRSHMWSQILLYFPEGKTFQKIRELEKTKIDPVFLNSCITFVAGLENVNKVLERKIQTLNYFIYGKSYLQKRIDSTQRPQNLEFMKEYFPEVLL